IGILRFAVADVGAAEPALLGTAGRRARGVPVSQRTAGSTPAVVFPVKGFSCGTGRYRLRAGVDTPDLSFFRACHDCAPLLGAGFGTRAQRRVRGPPNSPGDLPVLLEDLPCNRCAWVNGRNYTVTVSLPFAEEMFSEHAAPACALAGAACSEK